MKKYIRFIALTLCAALCLCFAACGKNSTTQQIPAAKGAKTGQIIIELYPEYAPKTVENFLKLVNEKFYDGLSFHRIVDDFMAQGGDGEPAGKTAASIPGEFAANGFMQNTLSHDKGVISMARTNDPNSASSQFFICISDTYKASLDGQYAAFGKVISGMDIIEDLCNVERTANGLGEMATPVKPVTITSARVLPDLPNAVEGHSYVQMEISYTVAEG